MKMDEASLYDVISKIFLTDTIKSHKNKNTWKLPTSTQQRATWHSDSLDTVVLPSASVSYYHTCCINGSTSPEYYGYTLVHVTKT
jgi:hypothetical protein